jgi:hypothetical protein
MIMGFVDIILKKNGWPGLLSMIFFFVSSVLKPIQAVSFLFFLSILVHIDLMGFDVQKAIVGSIVNRFFAGWVIGAVALVCGAVNP